MMQLGSYDPAVTTAAREAYLKQVEETTRVRLADIAAGCDRIALTQCAPDSQQPMTVAEVQQGLISTGFFPGGKVDGICGYRTLSAMRLFQEYVRSYEKLPCVPDGRFGPASQQHLKRWMSNRIVTAWAATIANWQSGTSMQTEYADWLALLEKVKQRYAADPNRMLKLVSAFPRATDTRSVERWDFSPAGNIHLIGIRRNEMSGRFDDVFVLLIKGLVFKFQGSTEPGAAGNAAGAAFLVQGQHDYHFGWHKSQYLALRPQHLDKGVLTVRSSNDLRLEDADLDKGLEANASINIHWGGKGLAGFVKTWSEGCQVINGAMYLNEKNELIDCSQFAAINNGDLAANSSKTRGAYNVLMDLVTALASDLPGSSIKYTLLIEQDLELAPALKQMLTEARARVGQKLA